MKILKDSKKCIARASKDLNKLIDTMTDDEGQILSCVNTQLVKKLRKISYNLYQEEEKIEINLIG